MKPLKTLLAGLSFLGGPSLQANADVLQMNELKDMGIRPDVIAQEFQVQHGIKIDLNQSLKVSTEDEGKSIRFETLDRHSVVVDIDLACGSPNKGDFGNAD